MRHQHQFSPSGRRAWSCNARVDDPERERLRALWWGGALILAGVLGLWQGQAAFEPHALWRLGLTLLAMSGLVRLLAYPGRSAKLRGVLRLALAAYGFAVLEHWWAWSLATTWPVLLMVGGAGLLLRAVFDRAAAPALAQPPVEPQP